MTKRCPACGRGHLFTKWFKLTDPCPRCGMRFEREDASFLGSLALNYGFTGLVLVVWLVIGVAATAPDIPLWPMLIGCGVIVLVIPALGYPFSKTTWAALDYLGQRSR